MTGAPLDQILALLQSVLRWEFLPEALVTGLFGSYAVWNLLQKGQPFPLDLIGPPPFDETRWMRIWGWGDFEEDLARDRANWPSQWREETQLARDTWQEAEERRVKDAHTIGKIVLVSVLVFVIYGCSSQSSATIEPTDTAETISGVPQIQIDLTDGLKSPEWPFSGTYDVSYQIIHGSDTCFLRVEAIERGSNKSTDIISEVLMLDQNLFIPYGTAFEWDSETFIGGYYAFQASGACETVKIFLKKRY